MVGLNRGTQTPTAAEVARRALARLGDGRLTRLPCAIVFWDGSVLPSSEPVPRFTVHVERRALAYVLQEPNQLGMTRAFLAGDLRLDGEVEDVLALRAQFRGMKVTPLDLARLAGAAVRLGGRDLLRRPPVPLSEHLPTGRRHSLLRDRSTVRHHYDVSNAFYRMLLGPTMVYSCAYFASPDEDLEAAQTRKLELICRKLRLQEGERFLDIGCGWGSLVLHAAEHHGVQAVGITLSEEQAQLARERIAAAGLQDRCEIRVADYREVHDGPFDKIASIGMYEHVGEAQLPAYAETMARLLRPGGLALNHGITRLYSSPAGPKSLIQRYVFPDGELHRLATVVDALQGAGLETRDVESLREHYALTLRRWLDNMAARRDEVVDEVGVERERVFRLYLTGSALAFEDDDISICQVLVARTGAPHGLPLVRGDVLAGSEPVTAG
jgi:cyclopropane-fatty-acyl-phospholipid synthase